MFRITAVNLTRDPLSARPDLGRSDLGSLDSAQLLILLENFRRLDPIQNHDAAPQLLIEAPSGKFTVRTIQMKLFLYESEALDSLPFELDAAEIVRRLEPSRHDKESTAAKIPASRKNLPRTVLALSILIASVAVDGFTFARILRTENVTERPLVTLVTDSRELIALEHSFLGRYTTGSHPGDRIVEVLDHGRVRFKEIGAAGERVESEDSYRMGHLGDTVCAITRNSGVIVVTNIETVVFSHDTYRRVGP
jgi:hypothetical protein